jgi:hypothetical protein
VFLEKFRLKTKVCLEKFIQTSTEFFSGLLKDRILEGVCFGGVMPMLLGFPCMFMNYEDN